MAFLGKQVLPDEIKIRELAEQISIKSSQSDPNSPLGSELHERITHSLITLQEHIKDVSLAGLYNRLHVMAQKYNLKFLAQQPLLIFIGPDNHNSFFFEVSSDKTGMVNSVKLTLGGTQTFEGKGHLVEELRKWNFGPFEDHVSTLHNLRTRLKGVDVASVFKILLATENILATVAKATEHSNLMDVILNGPIGYVTPRTMGLPMKLTIFASPQEFFGKPKLTSSLCPLPEGFGFPLLVSMESSTQTYPLPIDPHLFNLSTKQFQSLTQQNSITAPVTLLVNFPHEVPISAQTMFQIYRVVYMNDHAFQWPARRHTDENIIRDWAKQNSCDPDKAAAPNTCHTVQLPQQCHRYFHGSKWSSQDIPRQECGVALSKIPFLQPSQLLCCGPPPGDGGRDVADKTEYAFNIEGNPPGSIDVELDLMQDNGVTVKFKVVIPEAKPFLPEVQVGVSSQGTTPNLILSKALSKCLSIPVLLRSALKKPHLLGPAISNLISTYHSEMGFEITPPPKQSKIQ